MNADEIRRKAGLSYPHDPERTDAMLRQAICDAADEIDRLAIELAAQAQSDLSPDEQYVAAQAGHEALKEYRRANNL